jgi:DNA replication and repair protein RecF
MRITRIALEDFRNYRSWTIQPHPRVTVLTGQNAAGKTNVIEAIRLLTAGTSFRNPRWEDLVRHGAQRALSEITAEGDGRLVRIGLTVQEDGRHEFSVNGKKAGSRRGVAGLIPSVVFTPDDLELVKGPAEGRRREIDDLGEQLSPTYGSLRREYDRVVRQRNRLLKNEEIDRAQVSLWSERLVDLGARLRVHRARLVNRLGRAAVPVHGRVCADERLTVSYQKGRTQHRIPVPEHVTRAEEEQALRDELERRASEELARRVTLVGPHRDDIEFEVDDKPARSFASQGQQRTIVLSWKLAELAVVEEVTGGDAVLLLDDVMSELDATRRRALTAEVGERVQTFISTTNTGYFDDDLLADALVVPIGTGERS